MNHTQTLRYTTLPLATCPVCHKHTTAGMSGFCSLKCEQKNADRLLGRSWRAERAIRSRREAVEAARRGA
jgi:endogenous inhibitor of DNA gyrase (YacG/DUF329 family)